MQQMYGIFGGFGGFPLKNVPCCLGWCHIITLEVGTPPLEKMVNFLLDDDFYPNL